MTTTAVMTVKLNVACPETLSEVHAVGARNLCAPLHPKGKQKTKRIKWKPRAKAARRNTSILHGTLRYLT